jgi:hypothetical protein
MSYARVGAVLMSGLVVASCQTITEELPQQATALPASVPVPIIIVPVSIPPQSTSPAPVPGTGGSGSGGSGSGGGSTLPQPVPGQQQATPTPSSGNSGGGNNGGGNGGGGGNSGGGNGSCNTGNCDPIVSVHAYVYYIQCHGEAQLGTKFAEEGPADCDVRLDATPKKANGKGTDIICDPHWSIDGARWATPGNPFTPLVFSPGAGGSFTAQVEVCGVVSNSFTYRFR